jgi:hypothetical protein
MASRPRPLLSRPFSSGDYEHGTGFNERHRCNGERQTLLIVVDGEASREPDRVTRAIALAGAEQPNAQDLLTYARRQNQ